MNVDFRFCFVFSRKWNFIFVGIFVYDRKWKMLFGRPLVYITKRSWSWKKSWLHHWYHITRMQKSDSSSVSGIADILRHLTFLVLFSAQLYLHDDPEKKLKYACCIRQPGTTLTIEIGWVEERQGDTPVFTYHGRIKSEQHNWEMALQKH